MTALLSCRREREVEWRLNSIVYCQFKNNMTRLWQVNDNRNIKFSNRPPESAFLTCRLKKETKRLAGKITVTVNISCV